ncbi:MAG: Ig-like domain-containing protein [Pseudonocardiaceae bacterium]
MNEAADRRASQELSRLGYGLAAHVSVPPVTRIISWAPPRRALLLLEDMAAKISVPPLTRVIGREMPRRRAVVAGCSICALGALGAALLVAPGTPNGSIGPSELRTQHGQGSDSTSASGVFPLIMPPLEALPGAPFAAAPRADVKPAAAPPRTAKPAAAKPAAAKPAPAQPSGQAGNSANGNGSNNSNNSNSNNGNSNRPTQASITLTVTPASSVPSGTEETLTAKLTPAAALGKVQFKDGTTDIGTVDVSGGIAGMKTVLLPGKHKLIAVFTPTDSAAFERSTSNPIDIEVEPDPPATDPPATDPPVEKPLVEQDSGRISRGGAAAPIEQSPTEQLPPQPHGAATSTPLQRSG